MYKVLLADDEKNILLGIQLGMNWSELGCDLIGCASNGKEAIDLIKQSCPDIILSDISMEPLNGLDICRYVKENSLPIKCILMTGYHDFDNAYQAINYGVSTLLLKPTSRSDLVHAIQKAISEIEDTRQTNTLNEQLDIQARENMHLKQSLLFQRILTSQISEEDIKKNSNLLNIHLDTFFTVTIHIDSSSLPIHLDQVPSDSKDKPLMDRYLNSIFTGISKYVFQSSITVIHILFPVENDYFATFNLVYDKCRQLSEMIDAIADYCISIGISNPHQDITTLRQSIDESREAAFFISYDTEYPITDYASLPKLSSDSLKKIQNMLGTLTEEIQKLDFGKAEYSLQLLYADSDFNCLSFNDTKSIATFILSICIQQQILYGNLSSRLLDHASSQTLLNQCKTKEEIAYLLRETFTEISRQLYKEPTSSDMITNVKNYISLNYSSELTLNSIGKTFCISPGYLGKLFKQQEGINLSNYIQMIRIEKAKELILSSDYHTYEIGERVGITDPAYFSKLFKKITGYKVRDFKTNYKSNTYK